MSDIHHDVLGCHQLTLRIADKCYYLSPHGVLPHKTSYTQPRRYCLLCQ